MYQHIGDPMLQCPKTAYGHAELLARLYIATVASPALFARAHRRRTARGHVQRRLDHGQCTAFRPSLLPAGTSTP